GVVGAGASKVGSQLPIARCKVGKLFRREAVEPGGSRSLCQRLEGIPSVALPRRKAVTYALVPAKPSAAPGKLAGVELEQELSRSEPRSGMLVGDPGRQARSDPVARVSRQVGRAIGIAGQETKPAVIQRNAVRCPPSGGIHRALAGPGNREWAGAVAHHHGP